MEKKQDLRITKTYNALFNALGALLKEKKLEEITVNELCSLAMVRRATFYKHFPDKYAFFAFMVREIQDSYIYRAEESFRADDPCAYYIGVISSVFDFAEKNAEYFDSFTVSGTAGSILASLCSDKPAAAIVRHLKEDTISLRLQVSPELLAQIFSGALFQSAKWWYFHRDQVEKEEVVNQLSTLVRELQHAYGAAEYRTREQ